jgi:hypothetical protein
MEWITVFARFINNIRKLLQMQILRSLKIKILGICALVWLLTIVVLLVYGSRSGSDFSLVATLGYGVGHEYSDTAFGHYSDMFMYYNYDRRLIVYTYDDLESSRIVDEGCYYVSSTDPLSLASTYSKSTVFNTPFNTATFASLHVGSFVFPRKNSFLMFDELIRKNRIEDFVHYQFVGETSCVVIALFPPIDTDSFHLYYADRYCSYNYDVSQFCSEDSRTRKKYSDVKIVSNGDEYMMFNNSTMRFATITSHGLVETDLRLSVNRNTDFVLFAIDGKQYYFVVFSPLANTRDRSVNIYNSRCELLKRYKIRGNIIPFNAEISHGYVYLQFYSRGSGSSIFKSKSRLPLVVK